MKKLIAPLAFVALALVGGIVGGSLRTSDAQATFSPRLGGVAVFKGSADPSTGSGVHVVAPAMYVRTGTPQLWLKTGSGDTNWTQIPAVGDSPTFAALTVSGAVTASSFTGDIGVTHNLGPIQAGDTGQITVAAGTAYAQYVGRVPKALSSIQVKYYLHGVSAVAGGGGAGLNWGEAAIATGTVGDMSTAPSLTILGYTSINTDLTTATSIGTVWRSATVTATIPANTDLWVIVASSYQTTQASFRLPLSWVNARGYAATRASTQPSANLNTPLAFTSSPGAGTTVPYLTAQW